VLVFSLTWALIRRTSTNPKSSRRLAYERQRRCISSAETVYMVQGDGNSGLHKDSGGGDVSHDSPRPYIPKLTQHLSPIDSPAS
jgi:hypothetical protein